MAPSEFITRWEKAQGSERANAQPFIDGLCALLGVEPPLPATGDLREDAYRYERPIAFTDGTKERGAADVYKRATFVLETKQGIDAERAKAGRRQRKGHGVRGTDAWEATMEAARNQAEGYARNLEAGEPVPPFVIACDVGHCFDLYADFGGTGRVYVPFPSAGANRIYLRDLERAEVRETLRAVWDAPLSLDPARHQAAVTRDLAARLALLAQSLDSTGLGGRGTSFGNSAAAETTGEHGISAAAESEEVAAFLTRCLFCMFAEDAGLIEEDAFTGLLRAYQDDLGNLPHALSSFFRSMDEGGYVGEVRVTVPAFNGALFKSREAPPLDADQLGLLLDAAARDWKAVEPSIFGTLMERALNPAERHALGAHFTPRAYVERLVNPTVLEPLREEWAGVRAAVAASDVKGEEATTDRAKRAARDEGVGHLRAFQQRLATLRVLDPSCGSGNFLYVTFAGLKALEGEVRQALVRRGEPEILELPGVAVHPSQMLGIEVNARAAAIADLVLWIGYLQWYLRTHETTDALPEPILKGYGQVEHRDAVLAEDGAPAPWPKADFIVGNPPFIGASRMRDALGDDYTERLRTTYSRVPESADLVMYWWERAAEVVEQGEAERFGFITTNSITQTFNRRVVEARLGAEGMALAFAVPDHPWVDGADGADVRVAMTVGVAAGAFEREAGRLAVVTDEAEKSDGHREVGLAEFVGAINADLTVGPDVTEAEPLEANADLSNPGVKLHGAGFIVTPEEAESLGLGRVAGLEDHIRPYRNGRDITQTPRGVLVIDLFGLSAEEARERFPEVYEHVLREVKPSRDKNKRQSRRENWWLFGETNPKLRHQLDGLTRYIVTPETAKHRVFQFLPAEILPDNMLVNIALNDTYLLGVLSSAVHVEWALRAGGRLGAGNDPRYNKTKCFEPFPFPEASEADGATIANLGEALDAHRKARQRETGVTLTALYNAVEALRSGRDLSAREQEAADRGLAHTVLDLHRRLDRAVLDAYGWGDLDAEAPTFRAAVLERLVALNRQRREEERAGVVKYLRPEFQNPEAKGQGGLALVTPRQPEPEAAPRPWPSRLAAQTVAVRQAVQALGAADARAVAGRFSGVGPKGVAPVLEALAELGLVRETEAGAYAAG